HLRGLARRRRILHAGRGRILRRRHPGNRCRATWPARRFECHRGHDRRREQPSSNREGHVGPRPPRLWLEDWSHGFGINLSCGAWLPGSVRKGAVEVAGSVGKGAVEVAAYPLDRQLVTIGQLFATREAVAIAPFWVVVLHSVGSPCENSFPAPARHAFR